MTRREKLLSYTVGLAVSGLLGWEALQFSVVRPFNSLSNSLEQARTQRVDLQDVIKANRDAKQRWQARTAQTLSIDAGETQLRFLGDIAALLDRHRLMEQRSISPRSIRRDRKTGVIEVPLQVRVRGQLPGVLGFLADFYQRPYLVRLESLSLRGDEQTDKPGKTAKPSEMLDISFVATTLCLPKLEAAPHLPAGSMPELRQPPVIQSVDAYAPVLAVNMFKKYSPPPPVVQAPPTTRPSETRPVEVVRPADPRPNADKLVLVGTTSLNGELIAYVQDINKRSDPLQVFRPNEAIDDGTLLLVHARGIVVRVAASGAAPAEYFYPLGSNFKQRQPIAEVQDVEVLDDLRWARGAS